MAGKKSDAKSGTKGSHPEKDDPKRPKKDRKQADAEKGGGTASSKKDSGKKASGKKASGKKASGKRASGKRASGKRASGKRASGEKDSGKHRSGRSGSGGKDPVERTSASASEARSADPVEVLKLVLRDTEAKLIEAEHRLQQVQQQLDDERRALADAAGSVTEEAILDAAVSATVDEAVRGAEEVVEGAGALEDLAVEAEVLEIAATVLEEVAAEAGGAEPPAEEGVNAEVRGTESASDGDDDAGDAEPAPSPGPAVEADVPPTTADDTDAAPEALTPPLPAPPTGAADEPDESWTLVRLRQEAKRRGLSGTATLPKAGLLARLRG